MPRANRSLLPTALAAALVVLAGLPAQAGSGSSGGGPVPGWFVQRSPNTASATNILYDVAAIAPDDLWAVGTSGKTLTEHETGQGWSIVPSPSPGGPNDQATLYDVAGSSSNDVWAVGTNRHGTSDTLALHWDGIQWTVVPTPGTGSALSSYSLAGVSAPSATEAWAVGSSSVEAALRPFVLRWNGAAWSAVDTPMVRGVLLSVFARAPDDVWAVGQRFGSAGIRTLIERFDGDRWRIVHSPNPGAKANVLQSVTAVSPTDAWSVGFFSSDPTLNPTRSLTMHWDGVAWRRVKAPRVKSQDTLTDVSAGGGSVWAVGSFSNAGGHLRTLAERWDGSSWTPVLPRNPSRRGDELNGVAATGAFVVAAGDAVRTDGSVRTLIESYCIPCVRSA